MVQEEKYVKKIEEKEEPLGGVKRVEGTEVEKTNVVEPSTRAKQGRAENMAGKSGKMIGAGLKKVASVIGEFTAGVSKELKSHEKPKQGEQKVHKQAEQTEYRSETSGQMTQAPQAEVTENEKIEKKVTKETQ